MSRQSSYDATGSRNFYMPNGIQRPISSTTPNLYNAQMSPYYNYGPQSDKCYSPLGLLPAPPGYFYNPWSYSPSPRSQLFNPGQPPPPLPAEIKRPPLPPEPGKPSSRRGRCIYPRGALPRGGTKRGTFNGRLFSPSTSSSSTSGNSSGPEVTVTDNFQLDNVQVHKKTKRKPMSARYTRRKKEWCREDAIKALALEDEYNKLSRSPMLIIKFPDLLLNKHIVKQYSTAIETVHFQQPSTARYCFVQLKDGADVDGVQEELSNISFGEGKLSVEKKITNYESQQAKPEEIDPYTLYIGNLPTTISVAVVKNTFKTALYIDIGYAQRMKNTRYAFIRYGTVEDAMAAYKQTFNLLINARSLIVRFRRQKGNIGLPGETKLPNPKRTKPNPPVEMDFAITYKNRLKNSQPENEGADDSKKNILTDTGILMNKPADDDLECLDDQLQQTDETIRDGPIVTVKNEIRHDDDDEDADDGDRSLLGTKIKVEPLELQFINDPTYYDDMPEMDDDDVDLPLEEEDDLLDDYKFQDDDYQEEDDDDNDLYGPHHWERIRLRELQTIEEKPDVSLLPKFKVKSVDEVPKFPANEKGDAEKDDLEDLFNSMNPEDDDDF